MRKPVYGTTCRLTTIKNLSRVPASPQALATFLARPSQLDLYTYWHAITYLLTGAADGGDEPLCYLVKGGKRLGRNEAGLIRYLSPKRVARFSAAIAGVDPDEFGEQRYDLAELDAKGIYAERWREDGEDNDLLSNIRELFSYLQRYLANVGARGGGVIVSYENTELYFEDDA
jgi:hypothetical protein